MGVCPVVCVQRASVHRRSRDEAAKIDRELLRLLWDVEARAMAWFLLIGIVLVVCLVVAGSALTDQWRKSFPNWCRV